ncbi:MAG: hypothetical protein JW932_13100 [Deltaproteobacteria bacterium]|nr:hypothetical protein [Deltaproteobacteria bacterium]
MKKMVIVLLFVIFTLSMNISWAYDGKTHSKINEKATRVSQLDSLLLKLGFDQGIDSFVSGNSGERRVWQWIGYGGEAEDFGLPPFKNDPTSTRAFNHFHDPLEEWDEARLNNPITTALYMARYLRYPVSAILWGLDSGRQDFLKNYTGDWSWGKARDYYYKALAKRTEGERNQNLADCFRAVGQVMHLLQDMSIPLHTRNDVHIFPLNDRPLSLWTYETYVKHNIDAHLYKSVIFPPSVLLTDPQPDQNYTGITPASGLFDRDQYHSNSVLPDVNDAIGLSEFSNAFFLTQDTMWIYPNPAINDTNISEIAWTHPELIMAEDGTSDNRVYIRYKDGIGLDIEHLASVDYFTINYQSQITTILHAALSLDEECWKDYADLLIPRAVGYSADLLDYFFRGSIEITIADDGFYALTDDPTAGFTGLKLKAMNTTEDNEVMEDGTVDLVVKYRLSSGDPFTNAHPPTSWDFYYKVVPEQNNISSVPRDTPVELTFDLGGENAIPLWATDVYLYVVFRGKLGNEENAIAVGFKDISEPTPIDVFNNMDKICFNGVWEDAGDPDLIDYVDNPLNGGNNNGIADEYDVYAHNLTDIYFRFSPMDQPAFWPSETDYHYTVDRINGGEFSRSFYVLADYDMVYTFRATPEALAGDPFGHPYMYGYEDYQAVKNQIEWTGSYYTRWVPPFYDFRGVEMYGGIFIINEPYPDPDDLYACPYDL